MPFCNRSAENLRNMSHGSIELGMQLFAIHAGKTVTNPSQFSAANGNLLSEGQRHITFWATKNDLS